jgi:hypothetical protein
VLGRVNEECGLTRNDPSDDPAADEQWHRFCQTEAHPVRCPDGVVCVTGFQAELNPWQAIALEHRDIVSAGVVDDLDREYEVRTGRGSRTELDPERGQPSRLP